MPRPRKVSKPSLPEKTLVIDNGAYNIKAGYAPASLPSLSSSSDDALLSSCVTIPNCIAKLPGSKKTFVGAQLGQCRDFAEMVFRRPVQKGQLVNWEAEREIWSSSFFDDENVPVPCQAPSETCLLLTEAPNSLNILQSNVDQIVFEEFEFAAYRRITGPVLAAYNDVAGLMGDVDRNKEDGAGDEKMDVDEGSAADASATVEEPSTTQKKPTPQPKLPLGRGIATTECVLVIDSGYSNTTVTPIWRGRILQQAVRRLDIGGKFLTNYLKELVSLRQLDLTHEFHIVNEMKEDICFVTSDLRGDLERTWKHGPHYEGKIRQPLSDTIAAENANDGSVMEVVGSDTTADIASSLSASKPIVLDYVMPDYTTRFRGATRPHEATSAGRKAAKLRALAAASGGMGGAQDTVVTLGNERFAVPEVLFNPSDIGMTQAGLPEVIMDSVTAMPPGIWSAMLGNVVVVGGNANIPGFVERLCADLRPLVPVEVKLRVKKAPDAERAIWLGGARLAAGAREKGLMGEMFITKEEYHEHGEQWVMRQFANEKPLPW